MSRLETVRLHCIRHAICMLSAWQHSCCPSSRRLTSLHTQQT